MGCLGIQFCDNALDLGQLVHQVALCMQAAGGIGYDDIDIL